MDEEKYYGALENDDEYFDGENGYNEDDAKYDRLGAGGNSHFVTINADMKNDLTTMLEDLAQDVDSTINRAEDDEVPEEELEQDLIDLAKSSLRSYDSKITLNDKELNMLLNIADDYYEGNFDNEYEFLCQVLELLYKEDFICGQFSGNSQGDGMDYICPAKLEDKLDYIEGIIMGTCYTYELTDDKCTAEDIDNGNYDSYGGITTKGKAADVKAEVAKELHCSTDEIRIRDTSGNIE